MDKKITDELRARGAGIVRFVDISGLPETQTQGYPLAIVFCIPLSPEFIMDRINGVETQYDDFEEKEHKVGEVADWLAGHIVQMGHRAYAQSDDNNYQTGNFDTTTYMSTLPHKTIARLAGLGFIGKNNLLITREYGCAFSMCTVLTDAPIATQEYPIVETGCGDCDECVKACPENALHGVEWTVTGGREAMGDFSKCKCTLKCMLACPWTVKYASAAR